MAKSRVLKALLWLLSLPQIGVSLLVEAFPSKSIHTDLERCLIVAGMHGNSVPRTFIEALVLAEDHRSMLHPGIDVIAMIRAMWVRVTSGKIQGASTIEQQFVRVVSNRYERTFSRKFREQLLALMLARRLDKHAIASAYLAVAFYGSGSIGIEGLKTRFGADLSRVSFRQALQMVACLKYPRPLQPNIKWYSNVSARLNALTSCVEDADTLPTFAPKCMALSQHSHSSNATGLDH